MIKLNKKFRTSKMANRHPKHLKGREIGLWYRQKAKEKQEQQMSGDLPSSCSSEQITKKTSDGFLPTICSVSLPAETVKYIDEMLNLVNNDSSKSFSIEFEKFFNSILNTSFEDFVREEMNFYELGKSKVMGKMNNDLKLFSNEKIAQQDKYIRNKLPVFEKYNEIIKSILDNQIILISGNTGCGKTTQIPQFVLDYYIKNEQRTQCNIFCTQPRRISAITIAERVAWERKESLGVSVGYQIRLQSVQPRKRGSITYCTTGILLKKMENDPLLKDVSHIFLDEIHERDKDTDILLTLIKKICPFRKDLRVILMSATFCMEIFSKYFDNCPMIEVNGSLHTVTEYYLEDVLEDIEFDGFSNAESKRKRYGKFDKHKTDDFMKLIEPYIRSISHKYSTSTIKKIRDFASEEINIDLLKTLIFHIITTKPEGAILVFLPGYDKISGLHREITMSKFFRTKKMIIFPLHSMMPTVDQTAVFEKPPPGYWKVILSTNIAETSITIDDVVYVINSGKIKMTDYDQERNLQTLDEKWISLANAQQRRGRAGRVQAGICYHLYTRAREMTFERFPKPEILRTKLDGIILNIKMLRINDVEGFLQTMIDVPSLKTLKNSINLLKRINALDENEKLTPLGLHLARLPMDPQMGKMSLIASIFRCIDPISSIAASLSYKDLFHIPIDKGKEVDKIRKLLAKETRSDHLMFANVVEKFRETKNWNSRKKFCYEHFLSISTLNQLEKMKNQFCEILYEASFLHSSYPDNVYDNINSSNEKILRAVLCAGLYPNLTYLKKIRTLKNKVDAIHSMITAEDDKVEFHPSSVNSKERNFESRLFVYYTKQKSKALYIFDSTMVQPLPLLIFADDISSEVGTDGQHYLTIANKFRFKSDEHTTEIIMQLRKKLQLLFQKKALYPSPIEKDSSDDIFLNLLIYLLTKEDTMKNEE